MNRFFTLLLAASCLTAVGQVTYPYNPDGNADGDIAVGDLQDFLVTYGNPFLPQEVLVDGEPLSDVLGDLQTQIESTQLALGTTEYYWWQDLSWEASNTIPWESLARFDPDTDGFLTVNMRCTGGGNGFQLGVIPDSIEYADRNLLEAEFSESLTEGIYSRTIALSKSDCVVFSALIEQIPQICPREPTISWTPITTISSQPQDQSQTNGVNVQTVDFTNGDTIVVDTLATELVIRTNSLVLSYVAAQVSYINGTPTSIDSETLEEEDEVIAHLISGEFVGGVTTPSVEMTIELDHCQSNRLRICFEEIFDATAWGQIAQSISELNHPFWYNSWYWHSNYPKLSICDNCTLSRTVGELTQSHRSFGIYGECATCMPSVACIEFVKLGNGWAVAH